MRAPGRHMRLTDFLDVVIDGKAVCDHVALSAVPLFWASLVTALQSNEPCLATAQNEIGTLTLEPVRGDRAVLRLGSGGRVLAASRAVDRAQLADELLAAARQFFADFEPFDRDGIGSRLGLQ